LCWAVVQDCQKGLRVGEVYAGRLRILGVGTGNFLFRLLKRVILAARSHIHALVICEDFDIMRSQHGSLSEVRVEVNMKCKKFTSHTRLTTRACRERTRVKFARYAAILRHYISPRGRKLALTLCPQSDSFLQCERWISTHKDLTCQSSSVTRASRCELRTRVTCVESLFLLSAVLSRQSLSSALALCYSGLEFL
jgi:hypothetical protein